MTMRSGVDEELDNSWLLGILVYVVLFTGMLLLVVVGLSAISAGQDSKAVWPLLAAGILTVAALRYQPAYVESLNQDGIVIRGLLRRRALAWSDVEKATAFGRNPFMDSYTRMIIRTGSAQHGRHFLLVASQARTGATLNLMEKNGVGVTRTI